MTPRRVPSALLVLFMLLFLGACTSRIIYDRGVTPIVERPSPVVRIEASHYNQYNVLICRHYRADGTSFDGSCPTQPLRQPRVGVVWGVDVYGHASIEPVYRLPRPTVIIVEDDDDDHRWRGPRPTHDWDKWREHERRQRHAADEELWRRERALDRERELNRHRRHVCLKKKGRVCD